MHKFTSEVEKLTFYWIHILIFLNLLRFCVRSFRHRIRLHSFFSVHSCFGIIIVELLLIWLFFRIFWFPTSMRRFVVIFLKNIRKKYVVEIDASKLLSYLLTKIKIDAKLMPHKQNISLQICTYAQKSQGLITLQYQKLSK